ncbi:UPF0605 protein GA14893-like [Cimex lectularius]|uniref:Ciliary microtubule inner protein 2A-C-like domain-containing protein n=1 Tax=Cimex lectularius TaxID=79782 RepID=A0A8I6TH58_CIMLE|nr:UPF0605 protein GA14893-like [Cimex lectularius]
MSVCNINTPQPHYIPGYTGHVPTYVYRVGDTFGSATHKILLDPNTNHSDSLVLSDRTITDFEIYRPPKNVIDIIENRKHHVDARYKHPVVPGYSGFVPMAHGRSGQRFTVQVEEGLADFEKMQIRNRQAENSLRKEISVQSGAFLPNIDDKQLVKSEFKLPLLEVRPEACAILREITVPEPPSNPTSLLNSVSPYFMEESNDDKAFKPGYTGHIPYGYSKYGQGYSPYTNSALCDFTSNYRRRQNTEWAPVTAVRPDPPLLIQPTEIYHKHIGMLPNYGGHVPGSLFRAGKTYGNDTKDAKRWLRGDFS